MDDHTEHFGQRAAAMFEQRGPLCVGIDPHPYLMAEWGLSDSFESAARMSFRLVDALAEQVGFIKPQMAFFERFGSRGVALAEKVIARARSAGALVILDVKRSDMQTSLRAYAEAYLPVGAPLEADAITLSPYQGLGSLAPAIELAQEHGKGLFILALTSNPEGKEVQLALRGDGRTVGQAVIDQTGELNAPYALLGPLGVVIGATVGPAATGGDQPVSESENETDNTIPKSRETAHDLTKLRGPILVPGMGAQGGQPEDLKRVLGSAEKWSIPTYSRQIAQHGPRTADLRTAVKGLQAAYRVAPRL